MIVHVFTTKVRDVNEKNKSFFSVEALEAIFHVSEHEFKNGDIVKFTIEKVEEKSGSEKQGGVTPSQSDP